MKLIGHRGAREEAPENTLFGFSYLRQLGIDCVEFDVRMNKDKELVVIHDESLERTTHTEGLVKNFSTTELKQINACIQFPELEAEGVPTLRETLSAWPTLQHAQIEVKPPEQEDHLAICQQIDALLSEFALQDVCVVTSSDVPFLKSCQQYIPHVSRGYIFYDIEQHPIETCTDTGCSLLAIHWKLCFEDLIQQAHELGIEVSAWTVNKEKAFLKLKAWGIDSITDCPSLLLPLLDQEPGHL